MASKPEPPSDALTISLEPLLKADDSRADDECKVTRGRLDRGVALEDDLWTAVHCSTWAFKDDPAAMERLLEFTQKLHAEHARGSASKVFLVADSSSPAKCSIWKDLKKYGIDKPPFGHLRLFTPSRAAQAELTAQTCHLNSGEYRGMCLPFMNGEGHYSVTKNALKDVNLIQKRFSDSALGIVADAAQDPDFFAWFDMSAHAQTPDEAGVPTDVEGAKNAFVGFVKNRLKHVKILCEKGEVQHALHEFGYALHPLQDLMSHRGRTNTEHAYNSYKEVGDDGKARNPDNDPESINKALALTRRFVDDVTRGELKPCVEVWKTYSGGPVLPGKKMQWGYKMDLSPGAIREYKKSAAAFGAALESKGANAVRVRWFGEFHKSDDECQWLGTETECGRLVKRMVAP